MTLATTWARQRCQPCKAPIIFGICVVMLLCGCSSSTRIHRPLAPEVLNAEHRGYAAVTVTSADAGAPQYFLQLLSNDLTDLLTERSLLDTENGAYQVDIVLTSYQVQEGVARAILGVLAGPDRIESTVCVADRKTQQCVGESSVTSSDGLGSGDLINLAWMHAEEIASFLAGRR